MNNKIVIPFGISVDSTEKRKVKNLIVNKTGREPNIQSENNNMIVIPESPTHKKNIIQFLNNLDIKFRIE